MEEEGEGAESSKFLLSHDDPERTVDPEMQARLETLLEVAGEQFYFLTENDLDKTVVIKIFVHNVTLSS